MLGAENAESLRQHEIAPVMVDVRAIFAFLEQSFKAPGFGVARFQKSVLMKEILERYLIIIKRRRYK